MRHLARALAALAVLATACAGAAPTPDAVLADAPAPAARRLLLGIFHAPELEGWHRDMETGPDGIRLVLIRPHDPGHGLRDVMQVRLVPGEGGTAVFVEGWHVDRLGRRSSGEHVEVAVDAVATLAGEAPGARLARRPSD